MSGIRDRTWKIRSWGASDLVFERGPWNRNRSKTLVLDWNEEGFDWSNGDWGKELKRGGAREEERERGPEISVKGRRRNLVRGFIFLLSEISL